MIPHRELCSVTISGRERREQRLVLVESLLRDTGMRHEAESMKVSMLMSEILAN